MSTKTLTFCGQGTDVATVSIDSEDPCVVMSPSGSVSFEVIDWQTRHSILVNIRFVEEPSYSWQIGVAPMIPSASLPDWPMRWSAKKEIDQPASAVLELDVPRLASCVPVI